MFRPGVYEESAWSPEGEGTCIDGGTASDGIELGVRNGDFARICGLLGAGVLNPVCILEPLFCYVVKVRK